MPMTRWNMLAKIPKYMKLNLLVIFIFIIVTSSLTLGYSILSKKLDIDTNILLSAEDSIRINNMSAIAATDGGYEVYAGKYTRNTFTTSIGLANTNSTVSYTLSINNYSIKPMKIKSILRTAYDNEIISYEITGLDTTTVFAAGEEKTFTIIFSYNNLSEVPINQTLTALFEIEFMEYIVGEKEYATGNMLLDLRGIDAPSDNIWYDRTSNKPLSLTNAIYNVENKSYDFSREGSYGIITESIIPTTGDFTLEAYIKLPLILDEIADSAIVSQVADDTNDLGRIKLNLKDSTLITFFNRQKPHSTNLSYKFTTTPTANSDYLLQLVRTGDLLKLYLNGLLINSNEYLATNIISSGPFKLARWNDASIQPFKGQIYAVRVYGRALNDNELINNHDVDFINYKSGNKKYDSLKEYAINEQIVTMGEGLYLDNESRYVYRGVYPRNNLQIEGSDNLYRIISYETDNTMKIIDVSAKTTNAFDLSGNRNRTDSPYCTDSESNPPDETTLFYGCNAWGKAASFSNGQVTGQVLNDATLNTYLNTTYFNQLPNVVKSKIINHDFAIGIGVTDINRDAQNTQSFTLKWKGNIGMLTISDVLNASIDDVVLGDSQTFMFNYLIALTKKNEILWTMTAADINTYDVFAISLGTSIGKRRASRESQLANNATYIMYSMPAFYIKSDVAFTGTGTSTDPFVIK